MTPFVRKIATVALTGTVALTALAPAAQAEHRYRKWQHGDAYEYKHVRPHYPPRRYNTYRPAPRKDNDAAAAIALGIGAIALGAIIAGSANSQPAPVYRDAYPARPAYNSNRAVTYSSLEPWSPEWYDYCDQRYQSFNPSTGTFRGYDGLDHFCVAQ